MSGASESPFSARAVAIMVAIAVISFGGVLVLAGWAPELRQRDQAGDHPYSTSALGYNGFVRLLEAQGYPVSVSRLERNLEARDWGLMILTLPSFGDFDALEDTAFQLPALAVLPKWYGRPDPLNPSRQADTRFIDARELNDRIRSIYPDAEILRVNILRELDGDFDAGAVKPDVRLQLIRSDALETVIGTGDGALVAYDPDTGLYILSEAVRGAEITREDAGGQAQFGVVRQAHAFLVGVETHHGHHGSEDLLPRHA